MADDTDTKKRPEPKLPSDFTSEADFLSDMRKAYDSAVGADEHNRVAMTEDIEFTYGEQWDPAVKAQRLTRKKPCLSINRMPAFVAQVVNNRLLNETEIRVFPDKGGTKEVATLRQGLIKSIFKNSDADLARDEAAKYQAVCGVGYFHLNVDYAGDDVFDQDIRLEHVPDPLAVVLDEFSTMPCGGDAQRGWVVDYVPIEVYRKRYPWASVTDFGTDFASYRGPTTWYGTEAVMVASYWRMVEDGTKTLALTANGTTQELPKGATKDDIAMLVASGMIQTRPDGTPYVRTVPRRVAQKYLCSGADILEGPYNLPVSSIPIYRVSGWELRTGNRLHRWGLVRFLKDPQRLHNYWRSVIAEQLVAAPRNKWVATKDAVSGYENDWRNSHLSDDPLLIFNSEGQAPVRIAPPPADVALMEQAATTVQDIRDVSNIHEAALGQKSNEVSGKALQARQAMTDLGTFIYADRQRMADERCAKNINELIPTVYDTNRMKVIFGEDDKPMMAVLNDPASPETDVTLGKYGITVSVGPATITKRALAAEQMMAFVNAMPEQAALVMDLVAEAQDWPKSGEFMRRFQAGMPEGAINPDDLPDDVKMAQAEQKKMQAEAAQLAAAREQAEIDNITAQAEERRARAQSLLASGEKSIMEAEARVADVDANITEKEVDTRLRVLEAAKGLDDDGED